MELTEKQVYKLLEDILVYVINHGDSEMRKKVEEKAMKIVNTSFNMRNGG